LPWSSISCPRRTGVGDGFQEALGMALVAADDDDVIETWPWLELTGYQDPPLLAEGGGNVRIWTKARNMIEGVESDPIQSIKDGIPVLYFLGDDDGFHKRFLKVDSRLNFVYILTHNVDVGTKSKEMRGLGIPPVCMKIHLINNVLAGATARSFAEEHCIEPPSIGGSKSWKDLESSLVIVHYDEDEAKARERTLGQAPDRDHLLFFLASAQQRVKYCLEEVIFMAPDYEERAHQCARFVQSYRRHRALRESVKKQPPTIKAIRCDSYPALFRLWLKEVDIRLLYDQGPFQERTVTIACAMVPQDCPAEAHTIGQEQVLMTGADQCSLAYAMEETIYMHQIATRSIKNVDVVFKFIQDVPHVFSVHENQLWADLNDGLRKANTQQEFKKPAASLASSLAAALRQFSRLEHHYNELRGKAHQADLDIDDILLEADEFAAVNMLTTTTKSNEDLEHVHMYSKTLDIRSVAAGESTPPEGESGMAQSSMMKSSMFGKSELGNSAFGGAVFGSKKTATSAVGAKALEGSKTGSMVNGKAAPKGAASRGAGQAGAKDRPADVCSTGCGQM